MNAETMNALLIVFSVVAISVLCLAAIVMLSKATEEKADVEKPGPVRQNNDVQQP